MTLRNGFYLGTIALLIAVVHFLPAAAATWTYISIPFPSTADTTLHLNALEVVPTATGRLPLAVISHGSPRSASDRPRMQPGQYQDVGRWFADHGFAVIIPMRRGYDHSGGDWQEGSGDCRNPNYVRAGRTSAQDIEAVVAYMRGQPFVDPDHVILVGHSAGGWASLAAASGSPPGVVAAILFAPGRGSFAPDQVCRPDILAAAARTFGSSTHIPTLWIYAENDHYFSPTIAHDVYSAFQGASSAPSEFVGAAACAQDGHTLIRKCPEDWHSVVGTFLHKTVNLDR
jgi:dienelactone hydrolase